MALTRLITCKDTAASYKAAVTCERQLVPLMVFHPEFHAWLGMDLLRALLEVSSQTPNYRPLDSDSTACLGITRWIFAVNTLTYNRCNR